MKRIILAACCLLVTVYSPVRAGENPMFGGHKRQVALHIGAGVNSGFITPPPEQFVPYAMFQMQYSIPNTFFEMPARQSMNIIMNVGYGDRYGWDWDGFTIPIAYLSEDVTLIHGDKWYTGVGAGAGMQLQQNERIGSKLLFGFKVFAGMRVSSHWNVEMFIQHLSNGNTAPENNSYGFYGLGAVYSF